MSEEWEWEGREVVNQYEDGSKEREGRQRLTAKKGHLLGDN